MRLLRWIARLIGGIFAAGLMFFVNIWLWLISKVMRIAVIAQGKNPDENLIQKLTPLYEYCIVNSAQDEVGKEINVSHKDLREFYAGVGADMCAHEVEGDILEKQIPDIFDLSTPKGRSEFRAAMIEEALDKAESVEMDELLKKIEQREKEISDRLKQTTDKKSEKNKTDQVSNMADEMGSAWPPESIKYAADRIRDFEDARILEELDKAADELINKNASKPSKKKGKKTSNKSKTRRTSKSRKSPKKRNQ